MHSFKTKWERRYPGKIFYPRQHHFKQLKTLMTVPEGFNPIPHGEVLRRMDVFIGLDYWKVCQHNFSKFIEYFDNFAPVDKSKLPTATKLLFCEKCEHSYYEGHRCMCGRTDKEIEKLKEPKPIASVIDGMRPRTV
jgi:hypothetical protein